MCYRQIGNKFNDALSTPAAIFRNVLATVSKIGISLVTFDANLDFSRTQSRTQT